MEKALFEEIQDSRVTELLLYDCWVSITGISCSMAEISDWHIAIETKNSMNNLLEHQLLQLSDPQRMIPR